MSALEGPDATTIPDVEGPPPTILVVDNYDSFVYNLVQYVGTVVTRMGGGREHVVVRRNDAIDVAAIEALDPDGIVVSPGPGTPADAGVSMPLFEQLSIPTLGVCLGHQALCAAYGAPVGHAPSVVHGKASTITHDGAGLFEGLPSTFPVGRYHSLAVDRNQLPDCLEETAHTAVVDAGASAEESPDGDATDADLVMAVRHRELPHVGVQFHPESILTEGGLAMIANFCHRCTTT